jgi:hypothetical protein
MHVVVSDVRLGSGSRLWESPEDLRDQFHLDVVPRPSGVTHHLFWAKVTSAAGSFGGARRACVHF